MKFMGVIERVDTITVDGYSNRKTMEGAIKEFGRWIAKNLNELEGNMMVEYWDEALLPASESCGGYFLEVEEVPCASEWDEETETMKYADGRWYLVCRFVR